MAGRQLRELALRTALEPLIDRLFEPDPEPAVLPPGLRLSFHAATIEQRHRCPPAALGCRTKRFTAGPTVTGVRMQPEQEQERQLDLLAQQQGKTRSDCIREAIRQYLLCHGDSEEARRQSEHLAQLEQPHGSEQVPDWSDWSA